jgi:hypothetical protein
MSAVETNHLNDSLFYSSIVLGRGTTNCVHVNRFILTVGLI